jgi:hypothetical protein
VTDDALVTVRSFKSAYMPRRSATSTAAARANSEGALSRMISVS